VTLNEEFDHIWCKSLPDWRFFLKARNRQEILKNRQELCSCRAAVRKQPTGTSRQEKRVIPDGQPTEMFS
jgi:hypothetical protein